MKNGIRAALVTCAALLVTGGVVLAQAGAVGAQGSKLASSDVHQRSSALHAGNAVPPPVVAERQAETAYAMAYARTPPGEFFIRIQSTPIHDPMIKSHSAS